MYILCDTEVLPLRGQRLIESAAFCCALYMSFPLDRSAERLRLRSGRPYGFFFVT